MEWYNTSQPYANTSVGVAANCSLWATTVCPERLLCGVKIGGGTCNKTCFIYVN